MLILVLALGTHSLAHAQNEGIDSIKTKSDVLERIREALRDPASQTPYNIDIPESEVNRYDLKDYGSSHRFYRHLKYRTAEDYLMSEQEGYDPYGPEWERKLNENLMKVLRATFKEESEIMKIWKRIAPFLAFGIWEPYEVPITRVEHPQKVRVIEEP